MPVVLNVFALWTADSFLQAWAVPRLSHLPIWARKAKSSDGEELQAMGIQTLKIHGEFSTTLLATRSESPWSLGTSWGVDQFCRLETWQPRRRTWCFFSTLHYTDPGGRGDGWHDHVFPGMEAEWKTGLVHQKELSSWAAFQDLSINEMAIIHAVFSWEGFYMALSATLLSNQKSHPKSSNNSRTWLYSKSQGFWSPWFSCAMDLIFRTTTSFYSSSKPVLECAIAHGVEDLYAGRRSICLSSLADVWIKMA